MIKQKSFSSKDKPRKRRIAKLSVEEPSPGQVNQIRLSGPVQTRLLEVMPEHRSAAPLHQAAILQMQQRQGNAYVQRYLAALGRPGRRGQEAKGGTIQRDPAGKQEEGGGQAETAEKKGFDLERWLQGKIYEKLKEELGEKKLKEHASQIATQAAKLLLEQVKDATSEADFIQKAQAEQMGRLLTADLKKGIEALLKSPEGQRVRQFVLDMGGEPETAIGMALLGLGVMIAANAEIPELKKDFELGAGFKVGGQAKLGKFRELAIQQVQLGLNYSSTYFQAGLQGSYAGEGDKSGFGAKAEAKVGTTQLNFGSTATLDPEGNLKLDLGPALKLDILRASAGVTWKEQKGWSGVGKVRLGDKSKFLSSEVKIETDGKATMGHAIGLRSPFGVENLTVDASLHHSLNEPEISAAKLAGQYEIKESDKKGQGRYLFVRIEGGYQAPGKETKENLSGFILLGGRW